MNTTQKSGTDSWFAMQTQEYASMIQSVESELYDVLSDNTGVINDMCRHILSAGGKRIRPLLVLYSGLIFGRVTKELISAAVAAELIHAASLVHDDIIDESPLRRNRISINRKWGNHYAVLCGDYLFAKAFGTLARSRLLRSMDYMIEAIENMCSGEVLQEETRFDYDINLDLYYELIAKKTAVFLSCCCKSGAVTAGANEAQILALGDYGLNVGYAFQIVDDMLDFFGDTSAMGKPKFEDLRQGCITMPIIFLLEHQVYGKRVRQIIEERDFTKQSMEMITDALIGTGIAAKVNDIVFSHIRKAKDSLKILPECEYLTKLSSIADMVGSRIR